MRSISLVLFLLFLSFNLSFSQEHASTHKLRVGIYHNPPKVFQIPNGKADGVFIDVLEAIAQKENIQLQYIHGKWSDLITQLEKGQIDVLPDMVFSPERDFIFNLSLPVLSTWLQVFTTNKTAIQNINDLQNKSIGVITNSRQQEILQNTSLKKNINCRIMAYDDYHLLANALKEGEIDLIAAYRFFYFSELCEDIIIPTSLILEVSELHYGFSRHTDQSLKYLIDQNILELKNNPKSALYESLIKWYNHKHNGLPDYLIWIIAIGLIAFVTVSIFVILLRRQVAKKTQILEQNYKELIKAKEKAEESDQLKMLFLQNLSHEIRTPMNSIMGFIELIKESDIDEINKKYFDIISKSGSRLLVTINNLLEISKAESNQLEAVPTSINLNNLIKSQIDFFLPQIIKKELTIKNTEKLPSIQSQIMADKNLLNGIFNNLISNAIKFTPAGNIEVGCYLKDNDVVLFVRDTGIGIPADRFSAIFERFVYADITLSRSNEGLGLGLSIVKAYTKLLNGKVWLESEIHKGSTFFVSFPYQAAN
ncbi:transporter substrate-binding domain-containing protein [Prolixibacteraceae bacterium JC049]|nr:transporter substrate-binding domain-containing protein [Prolixibacteraceae bacterium JC049]